MDSIYIDGTYLRNNPAWHADDSAWKARHIHADDSAWKARHILAMLERNAIAPASVCEVGCGAGEILREMAAKLPRETRFFGYDISPSAYALCSQKASERMSFKLADLLEEDVHFDVVMAIDVFEHVEDYFSFLRKLKAKGRSKVFHIPLELSAQMVARGKPLLDARRSVGHIHHFCKETALATLEDCGYRIVDHAYTSGRTELGNLGWKTQLLKWPRQALYKFSPDTAARVLGGYSLLVLAE